MCPRWRLAGESCAGEGQMLVSVQMSSQRNSV